jgi:hypothetical protein
MKAGGAKTDLVSNEEEATNDQNSPDCNVGNDFSCQCVSSDGDSSIPVQSHKGPCQRARNSGNVNQSREDTMAEVEEGEIEEVHNQDHLGPNEVPTDEEHNECKLEKVVEDEVTSNSSGSLDMFAFVGEEVPQVCNLKEEEGEPGRLAKQNKAKRVAYQ